jgi:hypothetical protein
MRFMTEMLSQDKFVIVRFFLQQLKRVQIIARFGEALLDVAEVEFVDICEIAPETTPCVKSAQQPTRQPVVREVEPVSFITDADEILRSTVQRMAVVHMNMTPPTRASSVEGSVQTVSQCCFAIVKKPILIFSLFDTHRCTFCSLHRSQTASAAPLWPVVD